MRALFFVVLLFSQTTWSNSLSYTDFMNISLPERVVYLNKMQKAIKSIEAGTKYEESSNTKSAGWDIQIGLSKAEASLSSAPNYVYVLDKNGKETKVAVRAGSQTCFFAGHLSYVVDGVCRIPANSFVGDAKCDASGSRGIKCNPMLFGYGDANGSPICVKAANDSSEQCEKNKKRDPSESFTRNLPIVTGRTKGETLTSAIPAGFTEQYQYRFAEISNNLSSVCRQRNTSDCRLWQKNLENLQSQYCDRGQKTYERSRADSESIERSTLGICVGFNAERSRPNDINSTCGGEKISATMYGDDTDTLLIGSKDSEGYDIARYISCRVDNTFTENNPAAEARRLSNARALIKNLQKNARNLSCSGFTAMGAESRTASEQ